jgi:hypothetical protein
VFALLEYREPRLVTISITYAQLPVKCFCEKSSVPNFLIERNRTENETGVGQESDNKTEIKTDNKKSPGISPGDSGGFLHFNPVFAIFLQKNGFNCHFPFFCSIFARVIS